MPVLHVNGTDLHYEQSGSGEEVVLFSHGLLWSTRQFDPQVAVLSDRYRCVSWDHRGQGRSAVPQTGPMDLETLYADAVALIEALALGPVHFVGQSMGGFVGLRLAARRPDLVLSLTLMSTTADAEPAARQRKLQVLSWTTRLLGVPAILGPLERRMFGKTFLTAPSLSEQRAAAHQLLLQNDRSIARAIEGLLGRASVEDELMAIRSPTLVLVGDEDGAIDEIRVVAMHDAIPNSLITRVPEAGHAMTLEQPHAVNAALIAFLAKNQRTPQVRLSDDEDSRVQRLT